VTTLPRTGQVGEGVSPARDAGQSKAQASIKSQGSTNDVPLVLHEIIVGHLAR
jgi:hypothetical protein